MTLRLIFLFVLISFVEIYVFQAIKTITKIRWILYLYILFSTLIVAFIYYQFTKFDRSVGQTKTTLLTIGLFLLVFVPKITIFLILFLEDIVRFAVGNINYFAKNNITTHFLPERRAFVSKIALGIASVPFLSLLYGMTKGKYNFKVLKQTVYFADLPSNFDGFKITQISDIHSGSFDNPEKIQHAIDLINQNPTDMIVFTGDIVNSRAEEMQPWISIFNKIKKPNFGKFAVLGNHDYGEYITWKTSQEKEDNFIAIKNLYGQIGFQLLLNQNIKIKKNEQEIAIIGVENWGHNFKKAGDIQIASQGLFATDFKILLSHDPSHWEYEIKNHPKHFQLTLSGHTHGFQFGIEIPKFIKWSPVSYIYKQWAGLYENVGRYIYVNRGFGFHAYPGRVGIMPEITIIELKKENNKV